jgi:hypothetical protein
MGSLAGLLFVHARETGAGVTFAAETGLLFAQDPDTVRAPRAAVVASERADAVRTATSYRGHRGVKVHTGDAVLDLDEAVPGWRVPLPDLFA